MIIMSASVSRYSTSQTQTVFCSTKGDIVTLFLRFISLLRKTVHSLVNEVSLIFGHFRNFSVVKKILPPLVVVNGILLPLVVVNGILLNCFLKNSWVNGILPPLVGKFYQLVKFFYQWFSKSVEWNQTTWAWKHANFFAILHFLSSKHSNSFTISPLVEQSSIPNQKTNLTLEF